MHNPTFSFTAVVDNDGFALYPSEPEGVKDLPPKPVQPVTWHYTVDYFLSTISPRLMGQVSLVCLCTRPLTSFDVQLLEGFMGCYLKGWYSAQGGKVQAALQQTFIAEGMPLDHADLIATIRS